MTNSAAPDKLATELDPHCLQSQGISDFSRTGVKLWVTVRQVCQEEYFLLESELMSLSFLKRCFTILIFFIFIFLFFVCVFYWFFFSCCFCSCCRRFCMQFFINLLIRRSVFILFTEVCCARLDRALSKIG